MAEPAKITTAAEPTKTATVAEPAAKTAPTRSFHEKIASREHGIVTYGITPPKASTDPARLPKIAESQTERLRGMKVDAVVVYDLFEESQRTNDPRPFPFSATLDGVRFTREFLGPVPSPFIQFRCTAKYTPEQFGQFLEDPNVSATVFVGQSSSKERPSFTLEHAYQMRSAHRPGLPVGAVAIPERHAVKHDEHLRCLRKMEQGVSFFITQCCYNVEHAKNFLSDYYYACRDKGVPMVPILVTLSPCASKKSLEFLRWLGVDVAHWLENDLTRALDREEEVLDDSVDALVTMFRELLRFARAKRIPLGCNIESVAIRKAEIEASVHLVSVVRRMMREEYPSF